MAKQQIGRYVQLRYNAQSPDSRHLQILDTATRDMYQVVDNDEGGGEWELLIDFED